MRSLLLASLVACSPAYRIATGHRSPLPVLLVDAAAMTVAGAIGMDGYNQPGGEVQAAVGLGVFYGLIALDCAAEVW